MDSMVRKAGLTLWVLTTWYRRISDLGRHGRCPAFPLKKMKNTHYDLQEIRANLESGFLPGPMAFDLKNQRKMKTLVVLPIFCLFSLFQLIAQTKFTPDGISSAGQHLQGASLNFEFTLGEFVVGTIGTAPKATQGFNQPALDLMIGVIDPEYEGKIHVFPNPANDILNVTIESKEVFELRLFDLDGILLQSKGFSTTTQLEISKLVQGIYVLDIRKKEAPVFSVIIEKMK